MKLNYISILLFSFYLLVSCDNSDKNSVDSLLVISVTSSEAGEVYLNGKYTGYSTPVELSVSEGQYVIGVTTQSSNSYFRKEVLVTEDMDVSLSPKDKPQPKVWKALWIGIHEAKGVTNSGWCSTHFSKEELDQGFEFFKWSIAEHFEKFSYGTMQWEIQRIDITEPVELYKSNTAWYTLEPNTISQMVEDIQPGIYDVVYTFWRESEGECSFQSPYFGLAWTNPMIEEIKTGYVTIKFNAGDDLKSAIDWYMKNDPGVWVHEWLHTVGETYFQDLGYQLPNKGDDGLVVHAAEKYGYTYPWMNWYKDFISGRVRASGSERIYMGIGPEALLNDALRETALQQGTTTN